jgi:hypothetical protein
VLIDGRDKCLYEFIASHYLSLAWTSSELLQLRPA